MSVPGFGFRRSKPTSDVGFGGFRRPKPTSDVGCRFRGSGFVGRNQRRMSVSGFGFRRSKHTLDVGFGFRVS